jgi:hypothetical protein
MKLAKNLGKILISAVLIGDAIVSTAVDWNDSHLFNPAWTAHARFHDASMLNLLWGVTVLGLWLMWRRSSEPEVGVKAAALIPVIYRIAFLYITWVIPGTSLSPSAELPPHIGPIPIYGNVIAALVSIGLSLLGYWVYRRDSLHSQ